MSKTNGFMEAAFAEARAAKARGEVPIGAVVVLDGEIIDNDGTVFGPGDIVSYRDGTEHHSYTPNGCLLAVHIVAQETPVE